MDIFMIHADSTFRIIKNLSQIVLSAIEVQSDAESLLLFVLIIFQCLYTGEDREKHH